MQIRAVPEQSAAISGLWAAFGQLTQPQLPSSKAAHELLASSFVACCGASIAVVKMVLEVRTPRALPVWMTASSVRVVPAAAKGSGGADNMNASRGVAVLRLTSSSPLRP